MERDRLLFQRLLLHNSGTGSVQLDAGKRGHTAVAPDGLSLALIAPDGASVCLVPFVSVGAKPCSFRTTALVPGRPNEHIVHESFTALAWFSDSAHLLVAGSSGALYRLSARDLAFAGMWTPAEGPLPWAASGQNRSSRASRTIAGIALPDPETAILASSDGALWIVPLRAPQAQLAALKPMRLQGIHGDIKAITYSHRLEQLVVAGTGGPGKRCPGMCVSLWSWADRRLKLVKQHGSPLVGSAPKQQEAGGGGGPWSLSYSPTCEYVALALGGKRLLLVSSEDGELTDASEPAPGTPRGLRTATSCVEACASTAWWTPTAVALAGQSGEVDLAHLPGFTSLLGPPTLATQPHVPVKFAPGSMVSVKHEGADVGLIVIEPAGAADVPPQGAVAASGSGFRVWLLAARSVQQLLALHLAESQWDEALRLATAYGLDADEVYRARWASQAVSSASIRDTLSLLADRLWAAEEVVVGRAAPDAATQRELLQWGLDRCQEACQQLQDADDGIGGDSDARWWRRMRLVLLGHMDRLDTLLALHKGTFDPAAFEALRNAPLLEVATSWATLGDITALATLLYYHPFALGPVWLDVLSALPETVDPRTYAHLLPRVDGALPSVDPPGAQPGPAPPRQFGAPPAGQAAWQPPAKQVMQLLQRATADWVESNLTLRELKADGFEHLSASTEQLLAVSVGARIAATKPVPDVDALFDGEAAPAALHPPGPSPPESVESWYEGRALQLDEAAGQLGHAAALLELGLARGCDTQGRIGLLSRQARVLLAATPGLSTASPAAHEISTPQAAAASSPGWLVTLSSFSSLPPLDQLSLLMASSTESTLEQDITNRAAPFLLSLPPSQASDLAAGLLAHQLPLRPGWVRALVEVEGRRHRLFPSLDHLVPAVCAAIVSCQAPGIWKELMAVAQAARDAVTDAMEGTKGDSELQDSLSLLLGSLDEVTAYVKAGQVLASNGVQGTTVGSLKQLDTHGAEQLVALVLGHAERSGSSWTDKQWSGVWLELRDMQASVFPFLPAHQVMSMYCAVLLKAGRYSLAKSYLQGTGSVRLSPDQVERLVVAAASELLASATSLKDKCVGAAQQVLALAPPDSQAAQAELSLIAGLKRLAGLGVTLLPMELKQLGLGAAGAGASSSARDEARSALLQRLLSAGREAGLHRQLGVLLEVAELLGLAGTPEEVLQIKLLAAQSALKTGDMGTANALALELVGAGYGQAADLAADVACGLHLAGSASLGHAEAGSPPNDAPAAAQDNGSSIFSLAASMTGKQQRGADTTVAQLSPAQRVRLLSFAVRLTQDRERLPLLVAELGAAEQAALSPEEELSLAAAPDYHLTRALTSPLQRLPPGACPLPFPGDLPLALAVLGTVSGGVAEAQALVKGVIGDQGAGGGSHSSVASYATVQRAVMAGVHAHALRALRSIQPGRDHASLLCDLLECDPLQLLAKAKEAAATAGAPVPSEASEALAAADSLLGILRAASDGRSVKAVAPEADAGQLLTGDKTQRAQALLQQARVAGQQAAGLSLGGGGSTGARGSAGGAALGPTPDQVAAGARLLEQALEMCGAYGVPQAQVRLTAMVVALQSAPGISPEFSKLMSREVGALIQPQPPAPGEEVASGPLVVVSALALAVWPALPATSPAHLSLAVGLLRDALAAAGGGAEGGEANGDPRLVSSLQGRLAKLKDLLDKAGSALRGCEVRPLLTALLRPHLSSLPLPPLPEYLASLTPQPPAPPGSKGAANGGAATPRGGATVKGALAAVRGPQSGESSDPELPGLVAEAQAALFRYTTPTTVGAGAKLVKALQAIFAAPQQQGAGAGSTALVPGAPASVQQAAGKTLSALPVSLPYLCAFCKAFSVPVDQSSSRQAGSLASDAASSWTSLSQHLERLSPGQLRAWLDWLLLGSPKQPLSSSAAGKLAPLPGLSPELQATILGDSLPRLLPPDLMLSKDAVQGLSGEEQVATAAEQAASAPGAVTAAGALDPVTRKALGLYCSARVQVAAAAHQVKAPAGDAATAQALLSQTLAGVLVQAPRVSSAGPPLPHALALASASLPALELGPAALKVAEYTTLRPAQLVREAVDSATNRCLAAITAPAAQEEGAEAGLEELRALVLSTLGGDGGMGASQEQQPLQLLLQEVRGQVWDHLQAVVERLNPDMYARPSVISLLDIHTSLISGRAWPGWVPPGGAGGDDGMHMSAASAAGGGAQAESGGSAAASAAGHRLLLARTAAHLTSTGGPALGSALLPGGAPVTPDTLSSTESATQLFKALVQASSTPSHLLSLQALLTAVWQEGQVWGSSASEAQQQAAAAVGDGVEGREQPPSPQGLQVSPLSDGWLALGHAALRMACSGAEAGAASDSPSSSSAPVVALVDHLATTRQGATGAVQATPAGGNTPQMPTSVTPLSQSQVEELQQACLSLAYEAAAGEGGRDAVPNALYIALSLASPYQPVHATRGLQLLLGPPGSEVCSRAGVVPFEIGALLLVVCLHARILLQPGGPSPGAGDLPSTSVAQLDALLTRLLSAQYAAAAGGSSTHEAQEQHKEVVRLCWRSAVAQQCVAGRLPAAAALVAHQSHLSRALCTLGGGLAVLERFMKASLDYIKQHHPGHYSNSSSLGIPRALAEAVSQKLQEDVPTAWQMLSEALR